MQRILPVQYVFYTDEPFVCFGRSKPCGHMQAGLRHCLTNDVAKNFNCYGLKKKKSFGQQSLAAAVQSE